MAAATEERTVVLELTNILHQGHNNFCIIKGIVRESAKASAVGSSLVCIGKLGELTVGAYYKLTGVPKFNAKFNAWQLQFSTYEVNQTASAVGVKNYLIKECPHIAGERAEQIAKAFGDKAMEVIVNNPALLMSTIGLTKSMADAVQSWAKQEKELVTTKKLLYEAGLTTGLIKKLIEKYGTNTPTVLRNDAFQTIEIHGIGFLTADKVGQIFGMAPDNPDRVKQGVLYSLKEVMEDQGHTCVDHITLVNAAVKLLKVHKELVIDCIKQMIAAKELCTQSANPAEFSMYPALFKDLQ